MKIAKIAFAPVNNKLNLPEKSTSNKADNTINSGMELSNVCYKPVSFGRRIEEHRSWGARINPETGEGSFKIFTFPDAKKVSALVYDADNSDKGVEIELENKGGGVFEKTGIEKGILKDGYKYNFVIEKSDSQIITVKDPYAFKQDEINGASTVYDHSKFNWKNDKVWQENPNRITREGKNGKTVRDSRIYALSPDTINDDRSYEGAIKQLKKIKELGFNTVEVMHVENTFSFNWGYDGVDKLAPSAYLGGPDKLKSLVDEAHKEGLNVVFDVIPNHFGPDGNQLGKTGPYVKGPNDFGDAVNYEGQNSEYVRDFMINAMMNWVENYHVDGLRLDMTKYMDSDYTLKQLAAELNYHCPDCYLIAEDSRTGVAVDGKGNRWDDNNEVHDKRVTSKLLGDDYGENKTQDEHAAAIKKIIKGDTNLSRLGMDSEWDFNFFHKLDEAFYNPDTSSLINAALNAQDSVKYVMSHDEIGNHEGTRKISKVMVPKLNLNENIIFDEDDKARIQKYAQTKQKSLPEAEFIVRCQKAQLVGEKIATKYQTGELDKYKVSPDTPYSQGRTLRQKLKDEVLIPMGISPDAEITYEDIEKAFNKSFSQFKTATGFTNGVPGAKMVFQGDESADLTPFRFFRKFESIPNEDYLYTEKGYKPAESALKESTMGKIQYSENGKAYMKGFENLTKDLNKLNDENPALSKGYIKPETIVDHPLSGVAAFCSKDGENEIFVISNFKDESYRKDKGNQYGIKFPKGKWVEVLNTDDKKYCGSSRCMNEKVIEGDGSSNKEINLPAYSTVCFKKVG